MLFRSIVEQLDTELTRLHTLRKIVAELKGTSPVLRKLSPPPVPVVESAVDEKKADTPRPVRPRRAVAPRAPRPAALRSKGPTPTPLRHAIPQGPVVILPDQLARERARKVAIREAATEPTPSQQAEIVDLDGQSRTLASRWMPNSLAS